jgi:predicted alpha/beta-hydrolase family hydrolase
MNETHPIVIPSTVEGESLLPALLTAPSDPLALFVFAHGAGAGMRHSFMETMAEALSLRGVATLRWEFPYMARGSRRPDRAPVATAAVRRAVGRAVELCGDRLPDVPLFAGGKSFGGRMTSTAAAEVPLEGVHGLVFVGFPLHPAGRPGIERAEHLTHVRHPMLFLQGTRDALARLELLRPVIAGLGPRATLHIEEDADHGFHVRKRSGRDDEAVLESLAEALVGWVTSM